MYNVHKKKKKKKTLEFTLRGQVNSQLIYRL